MPDPGADPLVVLAGLVAELSREKDETRRLLAALGRGEITAAEVIDDLAARFQLGIGASVQALAEYDKDAARQLGTRLKGRLDAALGDIAKRGAVEGTSPRAAKFADRDDGVLRREYFIVSKILTSNAPVKTGDLIASARVLEPGISDEAVTAHLNRMVLAEVILKSGKGRYVRSLKTPAHRDSLTNEIETRGLAIPPVA